jgi:hypothetical protein
MSVDESLSQHLHDPDMGVIILQELQGRAIRIDRSTPRGQGPSRGPMGGRGGGGMGAFQKRELFSLISLNSLIYLIPPYLINKFNRLW